HRFHVVHYILGSRSCRAS
ncbi:hypothetical protein D030_2924B, partial [Vibrio parahaemolyticus AQ3810]